MPALSVRTLTEDTLATLAPDEVLLLAMYDPATTSQGATARGPAGFGAAEGIALLLPFVYDFFKKYVEAIGSEAGKRSFALVAAWLEKASPQAQAAARGQIEQTLREGGTPPEAIARTADSLMATLRKFA